jgi:hypothetical protein
MAYKVIIMRKAIIILAMILLVVNIVYAEQTVKSIDIPLGHEALTTPNEIIMYNFTVDVPDGITEILSLEFYSTGDYLASTKVYGGILVDAIPVLCNPSEWVAPPWNVDNYEINFDCSSLVQAAGWTGDPNIPLTFTFMADNFGSNVKPRVRMTYYNQPEPTIIVLGTYYEVGDAAKVIAQLSSEGEPINNASCYASIYKPDNSYLTQYQIMNRISDDGLYVYDINAPNTVGVYPIAVACDYVTQEDNYVVPSHTIKNSPVSLPV